MTSFEKRQADRKAADVVKAKEKEMKEEKEAERQVSPHGGVYFTIGELTDFVEKNHSPKGKTGSERGEGSL